MQKITIGFLILTAFFCLPLPKALALTANTGSLALTKTVLNPQTNTYVNSLGLSDPRYRPGDRVTFHIIVANLGKNTVDQAVITDTMPDYITFAVGPGTFNRQSHTLSFFVYAIKPGTTQAFSVSAVINNATSLPTNQTITCIANKVDLVGSNNEHAHDEASFCIQKTYAPTPVTSTPSTGPSDLSYLVLFGSALGGFGIRKIAKKA